MNKVFTSILNEILMSWTESNVVTTDAQHGLRPFHSTFGVIFALQTIMKKKISKKM